MREMMPMATPADRSARSVPAVSQLALRFFSFIVRRYFQRHFRAVHVQHAERLAAARGPLIIYANHSSWWDPMVSVLLARMLLPRRTHYAPMEAAALAKYPILSKIGIFPVDVHTTRGAAQFLRTAESILASGGVLWITPQGRFADVREPLAFKAGLGAIAARTPGCTLLPLAIEYTFWDERLPETLLRLGEPVLLAAGSSSEAATAQLSTALAATMQALAHDAIARDPSRFRVLLQGGRGTGGFYAIGKRLRARIRGKALDEDHTARAEEPIQPPAQPHGATDEREA